MPSDTPIPPPTKAEVSAAVQAALRARFALVRANDAPLTRRPVTLLRTDISTSQDPASAPSVDLAVHREVDQVSTRTTPEAINAAQEEALAAFPEDVRVAARLSIQELLDRASGKSPARTIRDDSLPPSLVPQRLPLPRPHFEVPPFPDAGLDDEVVRAEWAKAHSARHEAQFQLSPTVLREYAYAKLAYEKWQSKQGGHKPSGDRRYPVRRDRLDRIMEELRSSNARSLELADMTIAAIATGDVVGVECFDLLDETEEPDDATAGKWRHGGISVPRLILQSDLDKEAARLHALANRTPEEIAEQERIWDEIIASAQEEESPPDTAWLDANLPDLPIDRLPTKREVAAFSNAVAKHMRYLDKGEQIEAQRVRDAETKVRTSSRRAHEQANPEAAAAAKLTTKRAKAAERQRRWREARKGDKKGGP